MSPAAVVHANSSSTNDNKLRRSSIGYLPRETTNGLKSPKSPGRVSPTQQPNTRLCNTISPTISLRSTNAVENLHTPPKRTTRPSSLYSPPPTLTKFLKPHFERNFHEWVGFHDQNSRDSGFESTASTSSSSHRSTPVDHNDTEVIVNVSTSTFLSPKRQCQWDECPCPDLDDGDELLDHILSMHVQPLESDDTRSKCLEKYSCRWKDCKVYCKPSRLYAWLERHVVEKHAGPRPYGCPVPGCRQRFSVRTAAERHINSHFENATIVDVGGDASSTISKTKNKNLHTTNGCGPKKMTITTVIPTNNDRDLTSTSTDIGVEPENTCSAKILASTSTAVYKKRNHALKSNLSADPLDDKFVRNSLAWHLALSMTNERLASTSCSPCRKRNSGINHNQQQQKRQRRRFSDVDDEDVTFQCKVLARRRRNDDDDDFEFLVDWSPGGHLPWVWMPKNMYKNSFTVSNSFVSRLCASTSPSKP